MRFPTAILSTFIHEQAHWFFAQHHSDAAKAVAELRGLYPAIPVGFPEGSNDADGNYEHITIPGCIAPCFATGVGCGNWCANITWSRLEILRNQIGFDLYNRIEERERDC